MPSGVMRIQYDSYHCVVPAKSLASKYKSRADKYNSIGLEIASVSALDIFYPCLQLAQQDIEANGALCSQKAQCCEQCTANLQGFLSQAKLSDYNVAKLYGYEMDSLFSSAIKFLRQTQLAKLGSALLKGFESQLQPAGVLIEYIITGKTDVNSTVKGTEKLLETLLKVYSKNLKKKGILSKEMEAAMEADVNIIGYFSAVASSINNNYQQYAGDFSNAKMYIETAVEGTYSIAYKEALKIAFTPALAPAAEWLLDTASKRWGDLILGEGQGKGVAENFGDLVGCSVDAIQWTGEKLGEFAYSTANLVGSAVDSVADFVQDGLVKRAQNAFASWFEW